ncbi:MAG: class I poly(R)-hydroxyalkanoic acid synthase, partial [Methylocystis sp.]|nr:class I poly(R)-hydroxyalkanoic acid synthase [Methylocystis sp.]
MAKQRSVEAGAGKKRPARRKDAGAAVSPKKISRAESAPKSSKKATAPPRDDKAPQAKKPRATARQAKETPKAATAPAPVPPGADFEIFAENMARLVDQGRKALAAAIDSADAGDARSELAASVADAVKTLGAVAEHWMAKPERIAAAQAELYSGLTEIWRQTLRRYSGEEAPSIVRPDPSDKRFNAPEWDENPFFDWLRQSYLLVSRWANDFVDKTEGLDPHTRSKAAFYTRLLSSAVSPSNFIATNPELLRATVESKGENLVRGLAMLAEDISAGHGMLKIRQSDEKRFTLGVDLANTPGKVIWRNDVMELIQYAPMTKEVFARPLLIVPPWINKFYVLDLNPEKSFVRWATAQGFTVFIISWVNPDESRREKGFEAYMHEGVFEALDAVQK